jgi:hypothetical protein
MLVRLLLQEAEAWARNEINKQDMNQQYGLHIWCAREEVQVSGLAGVIKMLPSWYMLITYDVGMPVPVFHGPVPVGSPVPYEDKIREQVTFGLREIRAIAARQRNGGRPDVTAKGN